MTATRTAFVTLVTLVTLVVAACGGAPKAPDKPEPDPPQQVPDVPEGPGDVTPASVEAKAGLGGFPLPLDADDGQLVPEGGGKMSVYQVARGKDEVVAEVKSLVAAKGGTVDGEEISPRGAVRLDITLDGGVFKARFTGDDTRTAIIITAP